MLKPTIHLNGTSPEGLMEQVQGAMIACRNAISALASAAPNARDYYPQGSEAFSIALAEFEDRMNRMRSVLRELEEIAEHVADHME